MSASDSDCGVVLEVSLLLLVAEPSESTRVVAIVGSPSIALSRAIAESTDSAEGRRRWVSVRIGVRCVDRGVFLRIDCGVREALRSPVGNARSKPKSPICRVLYER